MAAARLSSRRVLAKVDPSSWWRSPIRGPWLTSVFGAVLLVGIPVEFVTGLVSYAAYNPRAGHNDPNAHVGALNFYLFDWVGAPVWLYRLTQGVHVMLGLALVPIVLAKLWSVIPKLFVLPPFRHLAQLLERASLVLLVGGIAFELVTGIMNIDYDYAWKFSFYDGHFLGAWLFITGFVVHVALKLPKMVQALRGRSVRAEMRTPLDETVAEPYDGPDGLVARSPAAPTISRRAALGLAGAASASIVVLTAGETVGGGFRDIAWLAPRGRSYGSGPNDFQINKTAAAARIRQTDTGPAWRLELTGPGGRQVLLSRDQLLGLRQVTALLPIACVEGWSTEQSWTGVAMRDLADMVGGRHASSATVESVERGSPYALIVLDRAQALAPAAMLALKVNGADLSMDHGYPARTIIPAAPGVHNTKWVRRISFDGGAV